MYDGICLQARWSCSDPNQYPRTPPAPLLPSQMQAEYYRTRSGQDRRKQAHECTGLGSGDSHHPVEAAVGCELQHYAGPQVALLLHHPQRLYNVWVAAETRQLSGLVHHSSLVFSVAVCCVAGRHDGGFCDQVGAFDGHRQAESRLGDGATGALAQGLASAQPDGVSLCNKKVRSGFCSQVPLGGHLRYHLCY